MRTTRVNIFVTNLESWIWDIGPPQPTAQPLPSSHASLPLRVATPTPFRPSFAILLAHPDSLQPSLLHNNTNMAMADLVMPRLPDNQQSWFHHPPHYSPTGHGHGHQRSNSYHMHQQQQQQQQQLYQQQQQQQQYQQIIQQPQRVSPPFASNSSDISPLSTSNNTSPVSPKNYHGRQVRPLYMPAVLRPNEFPAGAQVAKASPTGEEVDDDERVVRSSGSFTSLSGILSLSRLSRRSTNDSGKVVDWNWDLSNYAPVNGEPTRRHWKVRSKKKKKRFLSLRHTMRHCDTRRWHTNCTNTTQKIHRVPTWHIQCLGSQKWRQSHHILPAPAQQHPTDHFRPKLSKIQVTTKRLTISFFHTGRR